jgi:hypothetical protein
MKLLTNLDLTKNQLINPVIHLLASTPSSPTEGQVYYDTVDHHLYVYNNTEFKKLLLSGEIVNADIASGAAIALSKLATDPLARANHTGTQSADTLTDGTTNKAFLATERTKLAGIATGATANSSDATLLARANHTGTQAASTISDFDTQVRTSRLDQMAVPTGSVSLNSQKLTNVANGTDSNDAVNLSQLQSIQAGLDPKASVRAATTGNITLSGAQTIDGVSIIAGDRVLVKDQSTGSENGIWVAAAGAWSRAADADSDAEVTAGMFAFVEEGTTNGDSGWTLSTNNPIVVGTTALSFVQFSSAAAITAGAGLTKTGNTVDVIGTADRITVNSDSIDIASTYVGQNTITTLGTVTTGTWSATTIAVNKGGTGSTTAAGARTNLGAVGKYSALIGNGSSTTIAITQATHGLAADSTNIVAVYEVSTSDQVLCDVNVDSSTGDVELSFAVAPASNALRCVIMG